MSREPSRLRPRYNKENSQSVERGVNRACSNQEINNTTRPITRITITEHGAGAGAGGGGGDQGKQSVFKRLSE